MSLALIQPQFAPNLYDLAAMIKADEVILLDTDIWSRKGRSHRAQIRSESGTQWINIPIVTEDKNKPINEVRIDQSENWFEIFWNGILHNYSNAVYFDHFADELYDVLEAASGTEKLIDFNLNIFDPILTYLEVSINYHLSSTHKEINLSSGKVFQEYRSRNYIRQLDNNEIALEHHPEYTQAWSGFEPECSCLDLLLNLGPESFKVLDQL